MTRSWMNRSWKTRSWNWGDTISLVAGSMVYGLLVAGLASAGNAQENRTDRKSGGEPTDSAKEKDGSTAPEQMLQSLEESEKKSDQSLARQWRNVVRQRQWADSSGQRKVFAKYLSHDAKLEWVKLLIVARRGDEIESRRVKVPLSKLGKAEQLQVKRIAILRPRVEAATADTSSDDSTGSRPRDRFEDLAEEGYGRGEQFDEEVNDEGPRELRSGAASARRPPSARRLGAPPPVRPRMRPERAATTARRPVNFDPEQANLPDDAPWRSSFDAFRQNFSARRTDDGRWALSWGELAELQQTFVATLAAERGKEELLRGELSQPEAMLLADLLDAALANLGEVVWETTLSSSVYGPHARSDYGLPALPEPFRLVLRTEEQEGGDYSQLQAGQRVKFIGRFASVRGEEDYPTIVLRIRFPASLSSDQYGRVGDREQPPARSEDERREIDDDLDEKYEK